jgi:hypothetical protein
MRDLAGKSKIGDGSCDESVVKLLAVVGFVPARNTPQHGSDRSIECYREYDGRYPHP